MISYYIKRVDKNQVQLIFRECFACMQWSKDDGKVPVLGYMNSVPSPEQLDLIDKFVCALYYMKKGLVSICRSKKIYIIKFHVYGKVSTFRCKHDNLVHMLARCQARLSNEAFEQEEDMMYELERMFGFR